MNADAKLLEELQVLRREIDALRAQRSESAPARAPAATTGPDGNELIDTVRALVADAEETIRDHPAATVAAAFAAGVLVGRLLGKS